MDLRKRRNHPVDKLPIGTIRFRRVKRTNGTRFQVKVIKVTNQGPQKFINYSRFVWMRHNGPVPEGKRVIHKDGDLTNFDLSNLILGGAADVLWVHCHADPAKSEANHRAKGLATIRANIERAEVRRRLGPLATRWYAVDVGRREIINKPARELHGLSDQPGHLNGSGLVGWRLGWPGLTAAAACLLAAMAKCHGPRRLSDLAVEKIRSELMIEPARLRIETLRCMAVGLVRAGMAVRVRRGWYVVTDLAISSRGPVCPYVFVRGDELAGEKFAHFEFVDAREGAER